MLPYCVQNIPYYKFVSLVPVFIGKLLGMVPVSRHHTSFPFTEGLELLGVKWLPSLSLSQAKEITPCEVGDKLWKESLHKLTNGM